MLKSHLKISLTLSLGTSLQFSIVQMFGKKFFIKNCCMCKDSYRNYSVTRHDLQGKLGDFLYKNLSNVNDLSFKISDFGSNLS